MPCEVVLLPSVARTVERLDKRARASYDAKIRALKSEGCKAAGYRLLAAGGDDHHLCQTHLRGQWRMTTAFLRDGRIVVVKIARHTPTSNPSSQLAEVFSDLSQSGRRRSAKPPCCVDPAEPPLLTPMQEDLLHAL